jgi:anti-sigma factor RsiW
MINPSKTPCDTGRVKAWLDDELDATSASAVADHVANCPECRAEEAALRRSRSTVLAALACLDPAGAEGSPVEPALVRARARALSEIESNPSSWRWWMRPDILRSTAARRVVLSGLGVAAAVLVLFAFAPARQAAAQFLQLFRVSTFTLVPVSEERMQQLAGLEAALDAGLLGKPTVLREPGEPQAVADAAAASAAVGFAVREPTYLPEGMLRNAFHVADGPAVRMDMSRQQMQGLLDQAEITDVQLPDVEEVSVGVDVSRAAVQSFGPPPTSKDSTLGGGPVGVEPGKLPVRGRDLVGSASVKFVQVPRPVIKMPAGVDPAALGESLLQLLGIKQADAARLARTIDWTSTLVIPVPAGAAHYREVPVDGVSGVLMGPDGDGLRGERALLWQKGEIVYGLAGDGITDAELAQIADSLN